ncbi:MAG: flagellar assembly protein FliW [Candidatus Rokubacteria bacterium]|nr:flagellar assembly protein FliW [Candidatus Rokubacteria bacterium]
MIETISELILRSPKLGDVTYTLEDVVRFPQGIPGFEGLREFLLVSRDECTPFVFLASLDRPDVALPLLPLAVAAAGIAPVTEMVGSLGEAVSDDAMGYYAVVSIGANAQDIVVNLRAPVVVNLDTRLGCQVILEDETLPVGARLPA